MCLIDEAHLLHQDTLDHLHILTNYGWDARPLLTIVLVGLPELWGHRLAAIGCDRDLFSSDALALRYEASAGRLRDIDRLAAAALHLATDRGLGIVAAACSTRWSIGTTGGRRSGHHRA